MQSGNFCTSSDMRSGSVPLSSNDKIVRDGQGHMRLGVQDPIESQREDSKGSLSSRHYIWGTMK